MNVTPQQVLDRLAGVLCPSGVALTAAGVLSEIAINGDKVFFSISVDAVEIKVWEEARANAEAAVRAIPGVSAVMVALTAEHKPDSAAASLPPRSEQGIPHASTRRSPQNAASGSPMARQADIPGVAAVIAVASGKGGVGKSTTALNLALGLRDAGLRVGLLDADIYGPSIPRLTGIREKPQLTDDKKIVPIERFGLAIMSVGFLIEDESAVIWRGPMVTSAIRQMLRDVAWGKLDALIVDMPPGTGDAQLTLAQNVPLRGAVIISTPQDLSLIDARRGLAMFRKVNVPVFGIIENMSFFQCPQCGARSDIFGHGGAGHEAERLGVPFLGEIPLHMSIRETSDSGHPVVESEPDGPHAAIYRAIAKSICGRLHDTTTEVR